jgi:protein tyrosine/serine phosphatase
VPYEPLHLDWPGLVNARDVGGMPADGGVVRTGALIRSESLTGLSPDGVELVRTVGISRVIDLRRPVESDTAHPFADHEAYTNLPVEDPADATGQPSTMLELYLAMLDARPELFAAAVAAIAEAPPGAVVVHCAAGKDRTGLVVALTLTAIGVHRDVVAADYAITQERIAEQLERYLAELEEAHAEQVRAFQATPPESMHAVLDHLETTYGGVLAYLRRGGLTDDQVAALRRRLLDVR